MRRWLVACGLLGACGGVDGAGDPSGTDGTSSGSSSASGSPTGTSSTGSSSDDSSESGSESGTDTGGVDPTPILDREPAITHVCTETRAMTQLPGASSASVEALFAGDGEFFAAIAGESLVVSALALDGGVGDSLALETEPFAGRGPALVAAPTGMAALWTVGGGGEQLRFARIAPTLTFALDPTDVPETAGTYVLASALVLEPNGGAVALYGVAGGDGTTALHRIALDPDGAAVGAATEVATVGRGYGKAPASAVATGDGGHAVAYVTTDAAGSEVFFVILDDAGVPRFAPRRISRAAGDGWNSGFGRDPRRSVIAVGDAYWVTFTEDWFDFERMQGHTTVHLAVVDGDGTAQVHTLETPIEGTELRWPSFTTVDDRVGLLWASGSIIWLCAGCISDYDVHLVLLDPDALVPASEVVTQLHMTNGFRAPVVAVDGATLLTASSLDFHALTVPASGALQCVPTR